MSSEPAEYTSAIVANTSIVALLNEDLIRPLDSLVKKHGKGLKKNQLITCLLYTSPSPRDLDLSRMPSSA